MSCPFLWTPRAFGPLCSGVILCLRHKITPSARPLAPPFQITPAVLSRSLVFPLYGGFLIARKYRF